MDLLVGLLFAATVGAPALQPPSPIVLLPPPHVVVIATPSWKRVPTADDFASVYPARAAARDMPGAATIECKVSTEGVLGDCRVIAESPSGEGFGGSALRLAKYFIMAPSLKGGQSVGGGVVTIPMHFRHAG